MFQAPRGTSDLLPEEQHYWRYIESKAVALAGRYGFHRIDTPAFEDSNLFIRSVGEGTDIVEKEMYTFDDRGGDSITLRPEGTAPVCRAYLEHGMHNLSQPVRLFYFCPVFRYERPQAGRFRQHHQFGVEVLGDPDPSVDAEVIELAWQLTRDLGLREVNLFLNSIGDNKCRPAYIAELRDYYSGFKDRICADCRGRLDRNPLRLLDCKVETCRAIGDDAPQSAEHLCQECQDHWDRLRGYLAAMEIPYEVDHRLVRGLDYYSRTVFEIQPVDGGSQSTICGGGRYDGLIEQLGGRPTPGIGFATGMERLTLNLKNSGVKIPPSASPKYLVAKPMPGVGRPPNCSIGDDAPQSAEHLCQECQDHWDRLRGYLAAMEIPYEVDHRLVRGLDYYSRTVFEIQPVDGGSQSTICGGQPLS